jgi:hypothetical protein
MHGKIPTLSSSSKSSTLLLALAIGIQGLASAATIDIEPLVYGDISMDVSILVDGHEGCRIKRKGSDPAPMKDTPCRLSLSSTGSPIVVVGKYSIEDVASGQPTIRKGQQTFDLVDFEPATSKLARNGSPFGQRVNDFIKSARSFSSQHELQGFDLQGGKVSSKEDIEKAQNRLGYPLPPELASLLTTVGEIHEGDNAMTSIDTITDSYTMMLRDWGTDEPDLIESYSPKSLEVLKASTLLYTEVGDGLGGLLYRPPPTKACADKGLYVWTSQEEGTSSLSKNGACPDFERVFRWLLDRFVIEPLADEMHETTGSVLIDTTTGIQHLQLVAESGEEFRLMLKRSWQKDPAADDQAVVNQGAENWIRNCAVRFR